MQKFKRKRCTKTRDDKIRARILRRTLERIRTKQMPDGKVSCSVFVLRLRAPILCLAFGRRGGTEIRFDEFCACFRARILRESGDEDGALRRETIRFVPGFSANRGTKTVHEDARRLGLVPRSLQPNLGAMNLLS